MQNRQSKRLDAGRHHAGKLSTRKHGLYALLNPLFPSPYFC